MWPQGVTRQRLPDRPRTANHRGLTAHRLSGAKTVTRLGKGRTLFKLVTMASSPPKDAADARLLITKENRHQYFETAVASVRDADREIRQAEARGRARLLREAEMKEKFKRGLLAALGVLGVAAIAVVVWLARR